MNKVSTRHKSILLAPHNDDEILFGCYTLLREKPLVIICTDSYIEFNRGDGVTAEQRIQETIDAMKIVGCDVEFLHIRDDQFTEEELGERLKEYKAGVVYAPAIEINGNPIHNMVGKVANKLYKNVIHYMTYTVENTKTKGNIVLIPNAEERHIKELSLKMYPSQLKIKTTAAFFENRDVLMWESYE